MKYNRSAIMATAWASYKLHYMMCRPFNKQEFGRHLKRAWESAKYKAYAAAQSAIEEAEMVELVKNGREAIQTEIDALEEKKFSIRMINRWSRRDEDAMESIRERLSVLRKALARCEDTEKHVA